jgi:hypothetical protein
MAGQGPVDIEFVMWPTAQDEEEDDEEEDEEDDKPETGSLQYILDEIENEKCKAVNEAINSRLQNNFMTIAEIRLIQNDISKPFEKNAEETRQKFVKSKAMTEEEAKATVGVNDETRKKRRRVKRNVQNRMNEIQKEMSKAVHEALNFDKQACMSGTEARARIAKAEKPFLKKMEECRENAMKYTSLTMEELNAIVPNIELDDEGNEIPKKKSEAQARKDAEKAAFVPPRVVTDEGFPVSKAGMEKFIEITEEVSKRDQDSHGMYIYNDFSGYGVTEVMENVVCHHIFTCE